MKLTVLQQSMKEATILGALMLDIKGGMTKVSPDEVMEIQKEFLNEQGIRPTEADLEQLAIKSLMLYIKGESVKGVVDDIFDVIGKNSTVDELEDMLKAILV